MTTKPEPLRLRRELRSEFLDLSVSCVKLAYLIYGRTPCLFEQHLVDADQLNSVVAFLLEKHSHF